MLPKFHFFKFLTIVKKNSLKYYKSFACHFRLSIRQTNFNGSAQFQGQHIIIAVNNKMVEIPFFSFVTLSV